MRKPWPLNHPKEAKILQGASLLKEDPQLGTPLDSRCDGIEADLRFLIVPKHLVFCEVQDDMAEIVRILDG